MTMHFADIARRAAADGAIEAEEILALRQAGWADGVMTSAEADAVFALNDALPEPTTEWSDFFVEAVAEYAINGTEPKGYVSDETAAWLIERIDHDGAVGSLTELELIVRVLERSLNTPEPLKAYALEQVGQAVLTGQGATRRGGDLVPGQVSAGEAALLRRILFAPAGDGPATVSQKEAELLFALKDASLGAANAPEWKQLFVQGVASYLQGLASPAAQLSRERAAELDHAMNDAEVRVGRFIGRALTRRPDFRGALAALLGEKGRGRVGELTEAERVTPSEQVWLGAETNADGTIDEYEQALLDFLAEDAG